MVNLPPRIASLPPREATVGLEYIYQVSMALKAAFADRNPYLGDMEFVDVPLEWMISKEQGAEWRRHATGQGPGMKHR